VNIHHLELFYYVARHGGISAAVRRMPYGIQQPAVSTQILQLERDLGQMLFHRRPFGLTKVGTELYAFITPFFGGLDEFAEKLRGGEQTHLVIGAQELILRDYLPPVLRAMRKQLPAFTFTLHALHMAEIDEGLRAQQIDIGLHPIFERATDGLRQRVIVELPPCLLVPLDHPLRTAASLWRRGQIDDVLVSMPARAPLTATFLKALRQRGIEWPPGLELPSLDLVATYVVEGYGIGLSVMFPGVPSPPGTRVLALPGFPRLPIGARWLGTGSPLVHRFIQEATTFVRGKAGSTKTEAP
jgi:DNA-binding transcriptional LysR family regulator